MAFAFYETLGFESSLRDLPIPILRHIVLLSNIHLISIEFQNIDNKQDSVLEKPLLRL